MNVPRRGPCTVPVTSEAHPPYCCTIASNEIHTMIRFLTHSFTRSLTHSLTHSLAHTHTHSITTYSHSLPPSLTDSLTHARSHSPTHSLTHSPTHSPVSARITSFSPVCLTSASASAFPPSSVSVLSLKSSRSRLVPG